MRDQRIKLIFFSFKGSEGKEIVLSWGKIISLLFASFVFLLLLCGSTIALLTDYYHNFRIDRLTQTNSVLNNQLAQMSQKVASLESKMEVMEKDNNDLRVFAEMPPINKDIREVGIGGAESDESVASVNLLPATLGENVKKIDEALEKLERRMMLFVEERYEIRAELKERQNQLKRLPSIRPIAGGRISDKFGLRIDPFTDVQRHHDGLDISSLEGTEVYAAAAGTVIVALTSYVPNKGYGKEVVIDHGNGMSTRYAHLSQVLVKKGEKVERWQLIGKVGQTGRSTGPHLHYEVLSHGKPVNPDNYIFQN